MYIYIYAKKECKVISVENKFWFCSLCNSWLALISKQRVTGTGIDIRAGTSRVLYIYILFFISSCVFCYLGGMKLQ